MNFKPFDYQEGMVAHLKDNLQAALFCGMGLGKTACTLRAYVDLLNAGEMHGVLIIAPLRVCAVTWPDQVRRWGFSKHLKVVSMRTEEGVKAWEDGTADIYLANFEMIASKSIKGKKYPGLFERHVNGRMPVDTLLIDELSCLKANSKRTKTVIKYRSYFKRVHALTGTPSPNGLLDLFYPLKVLDGGERLGSNVVNFRSRWFDSDYMGYNYTPKPHAHDDIHNRISDICLVRRSEEHLDVPDCDVVDVDVTLTAPLRKQYKALEKTLLLDLGDSTVTAATAATLVNKLQQFTSGAVYDEDGETVRLHDIKLKALEKLIGKEPTLVLTRYRSEMDAVLDAFPEAEAFSEKQMHRWRAGEIKTWVANPKSLSHGIDGIQDSCRRIVWLSLTYSLEEYAQTNARIVRTGQEKAATIYRIMAADTVDWAVASALENKADGQSGLMMSIAILQKSDLPDEEPASCKRSLSSLF